MKNLVRLVAAAACAVISQFGAHAATIVSNGDFSANGASYTVSPGYSGSGNPAAITSFTGNEVNYAPGVDSYDAGLHADFAPVGYSASNPTDPEFFAFTQYVFSIPTLTQSLSLVTGATYTLSFVSAPRSGDAGLSGAGLEVSGTTMTGVLAANATSSDFLSTSTTFTVLSSSNVLTIVGPNGSISADAFPTEDFSKISITQIGFVPEPSSYALLGLGSLALLVSARRSRA